MHIDVFQYRNQKGAEEKKQTETYKIYIEKVKTKKKRHFIINKLIKSLNFATVDAYPFAMQMHRSALSKKKNK